MQHFTPFFLTFKSSLLVKRFFFFLIVAFAKPIPELTSRVQLASLVILLPEQLKYSTSSGCFCFDPSKSALGMTDVAIHSDDRRPSCDERFCTEVAVDSCLSVCLSIFRHFFF